MVSAPPATPTWGDGSTRRRVVDAGRDTVAVVATGLRLLARHWPVLLALAIAGVVARQLVIRLAVTASGVNGEFGLLVLILAPLATLTVWILMLRVLQASLPDPGPARDRPSILNYIGSALVPFLAVYEAYGYLREDVRDYVYGVFEAEVLRNADLFTNPDAVDLESRMFYDVTATSVAVVLVAIVLRWLLSRWRATETHRWLGIPGAYLEVLWVTLAVGATYGSITDVVTEWVNTRRAVHWVRALWQDLLDRLGWLAEPVQRVVGWAGDQLAHWDNVIGIPVAWLTIAAVVLGYGDVTSAAPAPTATAVVPHRARRAWRVVPPWLRSLAWQFIGVRFAPLLRSLRVLVAAGVRPMLVFCLAFVVAETVPHWLWELERWLIGPRDFLAVWVPLAWPLDAVNDALGRVLLICLVAAAVDRLLKRLPAAGSTPSGTPDQPPGPAPDQPTDGAPVQPAPGIYGRSNQAYRGSRPPASSRTPTGRAEAGSRKWAATFPSTASSRLQLEPLDRRAATSSDGRSW